MSVGEEYSYLSLTLWVLSAAYYGLFFAVPLRKYCFIQRKFKFPTGTAAAVTIDALFQGRELVQPSRNSSSTFEEEEENSEQFDGSSGKERATFLLKILGVSVLWMLLGNVIPVLLNVPIFFWVSLELCIFVANMFLLSVDYYCLTSGNVAW